MLAWIMNLGFAASTITTEVVTKKYGMLSAKHVRRRIRRGR